MPEALVLVERQDAVCTLTLNRPQALNSFTSAMHGELLAALDAAAADAGVRALILTGAGRAFSAGQDLNEPGMAGDVGDVVERHYLPLVERLASMPVPTVAAVNGVAAGAGANIALGCDIVFAGRGASFIQAFSKIGLVPDAGGTWLLPRLVGRARAIGLAMTGEKLMAEDAERLGLIWKCVGEATLMDYARAMAKQLAAMPTRALVATRQLIDGATTIGLREAALREAQAQRALGGAADFAEGVAAFREKRAPVFRDR